MVGWMKASVGRIKSWLVGYQSEMVLLVLVLVYVFASLVLHGCGGGGGGGQPQPSQTNSRGAVQNSSKALRQVRLTNLISFASSSRLRRLSRQGTCPQVTINWDGTGPLPDPLIITLDYGNGCKDEVGPFVGAFVSGSVTMRISNLLDEEGDLVGGKITFEFNNFSVDGETLSGTYTVEIVNELTANVSFDLDFQSGDCREHQTFQGIIALSADETFFTVTGNGTFSASYLGNLQVNYTATNLRFVETCDDPVGGTLKATYNGTTEEWSFPGTCGVGLVSVNGGTPQQVKLEDSPCG